MPSTRLLGPTRDLSSLKSEEGIACDGDETKLWRLVTASPTSDEEATAYLHTLLRYARERWHGTPERFDSLTEKQSQCLELAMRCIDDPGDEQSWRLLSKHAQGCGEFHPAFDLALAERAVDARLRDQRTTNQALVSIAQLVKGQPFLALAYEYAWRGALPECRFVLRGSIRIRYWLSYDYLVLGLGTIKEGTEGERSSAEATLFGILGEQEFRSKSCRHTIPESAFQIMYRTRRRESLVLCLQTARWSDVRPDALAYFNLVRLQIEGGELKGARMTLGAWYQALPDDFSGRALQPSAQLARAYADAARSDPEQAFAVIKEAIERGITFTPSIYLTALKKYHVAVPEVAAKAESVLEFMEARGADISIQHCYHVARALLTVGDPGMLERFVRGIFEQYKPAADEKKPLYLLLIRAYRYSAQTNDFRRICEEARRDECWDWRMDQQVAAISRGEEDYDNLSSKSFGELWPLIANYYNHFVHELSHLVGATRTRLAGLERHVNVLAGPQTSDAQSVEHTRVALQKLKGAHEELARRVAQYREVFASDVSGISARFSMREELEKLVEFNRSRAAGKHITLDFHAPNVAAFHQFEFVEGPRMALTLALQALIENAVEALVGASVPAGRIAISLTYDTRLPLTGARKLLVEVRDNGPGIPEERRQYLFQTGMTFKDGGGFGLGLALARNGVAHFGGTLVLAPASGDTGGACFQLYLPSASGPDDGTLEESSCEEENATEPWLSGECE